MKEFIATIPFGKIKKSFRHLLGGVRASVASFHQLIHNLFSAPASKKASMERSITAEWESICNPARPRVDLGSKQKSCPSTDDCALPKAPTKLLPPSVIEKIGLEKFSIRTECRQEPKVIKVT